MKINAWMMVVGLGMPMIAAAEAPNKPDETAPTKDAAKLDESDVKLVAHQHDTNRHELALGKLAGRRGTASVKSFGATMVTDHAAASKELIALAKSKGIPRIPPVVPETEVEKQDRADAAAAMKRLEKVRGAEFDRQFLALTITAHDKEIVRTDIAIAAAHDPDLAAVLRNVQALQKRHVDTARELQMTAVVGTR